MAEALQKGWDGFRFRRTLHGETLVLWRNLKLRCERIEMGFGKAKLKWNLTTDNSFTVKSLYRKLIEANCKFPHKFLRKVKVPAKIKVFLWLIAKKHTNQGLPT